MTETVSGDRAGRPRLSIVGAGRAGSALAVALHEAGYAIAAVATRRERVGAELARSVGAAVAPSPLQAARAADLTLLTVPDGALASVAATLAASGASLHGRALVHCSARRSREAIAALRIAGAQVGVLHPLQALCGVESAARLAGASFRVEGDGDLGSVLEGLVHDLGGEPLRVPAGALDLYHAAAVLAGNAPLVLLARASELLVAAGVEPGRARVALAPLLEGAAANARDRDPHHALTGPIVRGDVAAIEAHLRALEFDPATRELYARLAAEMLQLAQPLSSDVHARLRAALQLAPHDESDDRVA